MKKIKCIVIDDEPLACKGLSEYIAEVDALTLVAAVNNPADALTYLQDADLMYLDINMPKISGIDFLKQVNSPPPTIITTAYPQYALQGYELDVIDYLLKPIGFARFLKATNKAIDFIRRMNPGMADGVKPAAADFFFVKSDGILEKIVTDEIVAVEALANYIIMHCLEKKVVAYLTLKQISEYLPGPDFIQVHKSYLVATGKIEKIDHDSIFVKNLNIPVGQRYKEAVAQHAVKGKILKR
ncbi:MAG TPA: LytTR family DNA-binding domain-containing protein [Bacteroidia bacterium]|nr:LytTR family DNA-binding domain-containing protein [Bacteroidia bacterium]